MASATMEKKKVGRKPKKRKTTQIRVYEDQAERIVDIARSKDVDVSDLLEPLLAKMIEKEFPSALEWLKKEAERKAREFRTP